MLTNNILIFVLHINLLINFSMLYDWHLNQFTNINMLSVLQWQFPRMH